MLHSTPPADQRAEDIFFRTRIAFGARQFPAIMHYKVRVAGLRNGHWSGRTYNSSEEWPERTVFTHPISDEETADPVRPPSFSFYGFPPKRGMELPALIGVPKLAITYAFGLALAPVAQEDEEANSPLKTVGAVRAFAKTYDVEIGGEETIDGFPCWHLSLRPLGNPGRYRLRDLWVDKSSYETRRLITDGNFTEKETGSGNWLISFRQVDNSWYLVDELSQVDIVDHHNTYEAVDIRFFDIVANPHDNLDFGISSSLTDHEIDEPPETFR